MDHRVVGRIAIALAVERRSRRGVLRRGVGVAAALAAVSTEHRPAAIDKGERRLVQREGCDVRLVLEALLPTLAMLGQLGTLTLSTATSTLR